MLTYVIYNDIHIYIYICFTSCIFHIGLWAAYFVAGKTLQVPLAVPVQGMLARPVLDGPVGCLGARLPIGIRKPIGPSVNGWGVLLQQVGYTNGILF